MSTMRVTMTRTTMGESGSLLTAGSTYTVSTAFGAYLVGQAKAATDPDGALSPLGSEPLRLATNPVTGAASAVDGGGNLYGSRASRNVIATLGDSRMALNLTLNAGVNVSQWNASGVMAWVRRLTGQRFRFLYNGGAPADRTDQINARIPAALAVSPGIVVYWGGVNDIGQNYPTATTSGATVFANIKAASILARQAGALFVVFTEYPASTWNATQVAQMHELNARLSNWAQTTQDVLLFDAAKYMLDPTTATSPTLRSGYTIDGIHPSMRGAYILGSALASLLSPLAPALGPRRVAGLQDVFANNPYELVPNGNHQTTSGGGGSGTGGVSGTIPGSVNVTRNGSSAATAVSTVASPDGISGNDCVLTITGAATNDVVQYRPLPVLGNFVLGGTYQATVELDVSGAVNLDCARLFWSYEDSGTTSYFAIDGNYATADRPGVPNASAWSETLMTNAMTIPATGITLTAVRMYLEISFNGAAGAAVVKVRNVSLRRIPD